MDVEVVRGLEFFVLFVVYCTMYRWRVGLEQKE